MAPSKRTSKIIKVLVIDSDRTSLKVLEAMFRLCKYNVTAIGHPLMGIQILREAKKKSSGYDLVVTSADSMPEMDGLELMDFVTRNMDIPVVLVSSSDEKQTIRTATLRGAKDFLLKPLKLHEVKMMWQYVLRHQKFLLKNRDDHGKEPIATSGKKKRSDEKNDSKRKDLRSQKWRKRFTWTTELKKKFIAAFTELGPENASPSKILKLMNVGDQVARKQIASKLQKHRIYLRKQVAEGRGRTNYPAVRDAGPSTANNPTSLVPQPLPATGCATNSIPSGQDVVHQQSNSFGPSFTNMPSYYSHFGVDGDRGMGNYRMVHSTDPILSSIRWRAFFMQQQRNQGVQSIPQSPYVIQSGHGRYRTMWDPSLHMNYDGLAHNYLQHNMPFQGRAFGQKNSDSHLSVGGTSHLDAGPSSRTAWAMNGSQSEGLHASTSGVIYHDMHEESIFASALATRSQPTDQRSSGTQHELLGSGSPSQPSTSSFEINDLNLAHQSHGMQDALIPPSSVLQAQNPNYDACGSSNLYLENMNIGFSSSQNPGDLERMLDDLIIPPQHQLQPSDLDSLFPMDDQGCRTDNAQCTNQPRQYDLSGSSLQSQPCTSSSDVTTLASSHLRGTQDISVEVQNPNDVCGSSNLDNMNVATSLSQSLGAHEKMLDDLIIPPECQLQPSDLDSLFPMED